MVDALINAIQRDERYNFLSGNIHSISSWNMDLVEKNYDVFPTLL
jgi:hypothetical protein